MEKPILADADRFPTDKIIFGLIGKRKSHWLSLFKYIDETYPEFSREWRYYKDGKSWLMKITRKSKTIFWLSVIKGSFRTTFYFTDKAKEVIKSSSLRDELKEQFNKKSGHRGITVVFRNKRDVDSVRALISMKLSLK